jgi:hypothetical protein
MKVVLDFFSSKIMLYPMVPSLKLFEFVWTHLSDYLLVEALVIYYNYSMLTIRTT